ncbi:MAG: NADP-dependent phosphogluconate dehydrogenase [Ferruginibacter sp.]
MADTAYTYGMIGLGTMGANLVLNMSDHGFSVAGYDKNIKQVDSLNAAAENRPVKAFSDLSAFVRSLEIPKMILLLVPAGPIVNAVIEELKPLIGKDDIIVDCGNSHFVDTQLRIEHLAKEGIHFVGLGISGGETGARLGPSIMPGGNIEAYKKLSPMLEAVAAKVNGVPCTAYMGSGASGHYVKMVHNGIEYAIMQMLAETYHLLKKFAGLGNEEIHYVFREWNKGRLQSFLLEITAAVFLQKDEHSAEMLIDKISDTAHQKGTGAWMSQDAMATGSPIPSIDAAVSARSVSSMKKERVLASGVLKGVGITAFTGDKNAFIHRLEEALYVGYILTYAQGLAMLHTSSVFYKYGTDITTVAKIWRGGCIIRAVLLEDITEAYQSEKELKNMLNHKKFSETINNTEGSLRSIVQTGAGAGIPLPAFAACLNYYDAYRSEWLPANLIQAQRDFFGAHTYERTDKEGSFHTIWNATIQ